ncbi:MAG: hypothetical protein QOC79_1067 [Actinomycetota bacterium]|jgi:hypothetical protein|nr:hypothetical protein [Actinomycetota bacterium]MDQ1454909.1 hypothetical protein [Actinomycetota bacterium]
MAAIECPHCGSSVEVTDESAIRKGHAASSDKPREWVIYERGNEVHRCGAA